MIRVRYSLLPEGLHAQARREGGRTILYLRPGLTSEQRREALQRARRSARMGHGPRLPAAWLALALAADRVRATVRNVIAAIRHHPLGTSMLATLLAGAVISYSLFVTVSVRLIYPQAQGPPPPQPHTTTTPAAGPGTSSPARPVPGTPPAGSPGGGSSAGVVAAPSPGGSAGAGRSPRPSPAPTPSSPGPTPSRLPSPSPTPSSGGGLAVGVCVKVGSLGVCLNL